VVVVVGEAPGCIQGTLRLHEAEVGDYRSRILDYRLEQGCALGCTLEWGCELDDANADGTSISEGQGGRSGKRGR